MKMHQLVIQSLISLLLAVIGFVEFIDGDPWVSLLAAGSSIFILAFGIMFAMDQKKLDQQISAFEKELADDNARLQRLLEERAQRDLMRNDESNSCPGFHNS